MQRGEEQVEKEENKKSIALKALQKDSEEESIDEFSDEDGNTAMLTRKFKKFLRKKNLSK